MSSALLLRSQIEARIPAAFAVNKRPDRECFPTGILQIDALTGGVPTHSLTEICGSQVASSGKTSVVGSLLAHVTSEQFVAVVDAGDSFDPSSALAAGTNLSRLLWVRCGKTRQKLRPLEQAFKVTDMLLQSGGFGLIVVDLSDIPDRFVRNVPLSTWFRFSRVIEKQRSALVFLEQQAHATSCAGLVLSLKSEPSVFSGTLLTQVNISVGVLRIHDKKPVQTVRPSFPVKAQWA